MYITDKLVKAVNEQYYRKYQKTAMIPIDENISQSCIKIHKQIAKNDTEMCNMLRDLFMLNFIDEDAVCLSKVGLAARNKMIIYNTILTKTFENVSNTTKEVIAILKMNSIASCVVGGCVRDSLLKKEAKDFDFVTDISYDSLKGIFEYRGFTVKETGKEFLVMIVAKNGEEFEIANFRKDGTYEDGRRPTSVEIGTLNDDAQRRDLTINALYWNLRYQRLDDPSGKGIDDISNRVLRFIGKPEKRIEEDALRVFRFYRFLHKLPGFEADSKSLKAVRNIFTEAFKRTTPERARNEIEKMVGLC